MYQRIYFNAKEYYLESRQFISHLKRQAVSEAFTLLSPTIFHQISERDVKLINEILKQELIFRDTYNWIEFRANEKTFSENEMWAYYENIKALKSNKESFIKPEGLLFPSMESFIHCAQDLLVSELESLYQDTVVNLSPGALMREREFRYERGFKALKKRQEVAYNFMRDAAHDSFADFEGWYENSSLP